MTAKGAGVTAGIGGVIGYNVTGRVTACRFQGKLSNSKGSSGSMGGVVGNNSTVMKTDESTITACYANCEFENPSYYTGGVIGTNNNFGNSQVIACYSVVKASSSNIGGVCGRGDKSQLTSCYWNKLQGSETYPQYGINNDVTTNENATEVKDNSWSDAKSAMNNTLSLSSMGWQYKENTDSDSAVFPLIVEK